MELPRAIIPQVPGLHKFQTHALNTQSMPGSGNRTVPTNAHGTAFLRHARYCFLGPSPLTSLSGMFCISIFLCVKTQSLQAPAPIPTPP